MTAIDTQAQTKPLRMKLPLFCGCSIAFEILTGTYGPCPCGNTLVVTATSAGEFEVKCETPA